MGGRYSCEEKKTKKGLKLELNLGSDVKSDTDKRQRGRMCKALLLPRTAISVKVRLTTKN